MTVTLLKSDCVPIMRTMQDGCIDLTVTSPPYDNLREYKGYVFSFEAIARELYRITKDGGVVVWVVGDATINGSETGTSFRQALYFKECGFNLHDTMIYETDKPPMNDRRYQASYEYMFILSKGRNKTFNPIMRPSRKAGIKRTGITYREKDSTLKAQWRGGVVSNETIMENIWYYPTGGKNIGHPATFPEALARDHIISWSNEGDTVFDPMMGSGTTGKMAVLNDRDFIGCEIAQEYFDIAERRIKQAQEARQLELV